MSIKNYSFDLKLKASKNPLIKNINLVKGDTNNVLSLTIVDDGAVFDLTNVSNAQITFEKADGTIVNNLGNITDITGGVIEFSLTSQVVSLPGKVNATVELFEADGDRITTSQFIFEVIDEIFNEGEIESASEYGTLNVLISDVNTLNTDITDAEITRTTSESMRITSESTRVVSENIRITNEDVRIANESTRVTQEANRVSAGDARTINEDMRINNENTRIASENTRATSESVRITNEDTRIASEDTRATSEGVRINNEINRVNEFDTSQLEREGTFTANEVIRDGLLDDKLLLADDKIVELNTTNTNVNNAESTRVNNENTRVSTHSTRLSEMDMKIGELDTKIIQADNIPNIDYDNRLNKLETSETATLTNTSNHYTMGKGKNADGVVLDYSQEVTKGIINDVVIGGVSYPKPIAYDTSKWRRCNVLDDGTVSAYYGDANYKEDGTNGQVMVEIHKGYGMTKFDNNIREDYLSSTKAWGFEVHPAFIRNGVEIDKVYIGAYEGSIFDVSASEYLANDEQVADFMIATGDKLSSIANVKPCSGLTQNLTLPNSRILAQNRGVGWELQDFWTISFIQACLFVEHKTFDSQSAIGYGVCGISDDGSTNMAINTGETSSLGNDSGESNTVTHYQTGQSVKAVSYHGIENLWGNIWKWVDGINILDNVPYVADYGFQSDKFSGNYKNLGLTLSQSNGYVEDWASIKYGFLPSLTGTNKIGDYYYQASGARVARLGGTWSSGSYVGVTYWALDSSSGFRTRNIGARLLYIPQGGGN